MTVDPSRTYLFEVVFGHGYSMQSIDTWWDGFAQSTRTVTSFFVDVGSQWFGCDTLAAQQNANKSATTHTTTILTGLSVAVAGPSVLTMTGTVTRTTTTLIHHPNGTVEMEDPETASSNDIVAVDVSRLTTIPSDYVGLMYPSAPAPTSIGGTPTRFTLRGDFRRPKWATTTRMLTDDELLSVAQCAARVKLSGPQLLAILLDLTGARQDAYHPDGFYGIAGLSTAQLISLLAGGPVGAAQRFLEFSVDRQLTLAGSALEQPGVVGNPIAIYLTLATGVTGPNWANAGPATPVPSPLPPRLQHLSSDGTTLTAAAIAARIDARTATLVDEFNRRLPLSMGTTAD